MVHNLDKFEWLAQTPVFTRHLFTWNARTRFELGSAKAEGCPRDDSWDILLYPVIAIVKKFQGCAVDPPSYL
jgi:hypothetical protein